MEQGRWRGGRYCGGTAAVNKTRQEKAFEAGHNWILLNIQHVSAFSGLFVLVVDARQVRESEDTPACCFKNWLFGPVCKQTCFLRACRDRKSLSHSIRRLC